MIGHGLPDRAERADAASTSGGPRRAHQFRIIGGPYDAFKRGENADFGVCVRAERVPDDVDVLAADPRFRRAAADQLGDVEYAIRRDAGRRR